MIRTVRQYLDSLDDGRVVCCLGESAGCAKPSDTPHNHSVCGHGLCFAQRSPVSPPFRQGYNTKVQNMSTFDDAGAYAYYAHLWLKK